MKFGAARRRFYRQLGANGFDSPSLTPAQALDSMLAAYRTDRYRGCEVEGGGDTLSARWGLRYWGRGDWFEFEIARRLFDERSGKGRLLRVVFRYLPHTIEAPARDGRIECASPAEAPQFRTRVRRSAGYRAALRGEHSHVDILFPTIR